MNDRKTNWPLTLILWLLLAALPVAVVVSIVRLVTA